MAITLVQSASSPTWSVSGASVSFGSNPASGNAVIVLTTSNNGGSDTFGPVTGVGGTFAESATGQWSSLWCAPGVTGGSAGVTINDTSSQWASGILEFSGITGAAVATNTINGFQQSTINITPTAIGQLVVVSTNGGAATSCTPPVGWSSLAFTAFGGSQIQVIYLISTGTATLSPTFTTVTGFQELNAAVYNPSVVGPGPLVAANLAGPGGAFF